MNEHHLGDDAELYALGTLEPVERAIVEAHAAQCESCAIRVGRAEAAVDALAQALPAYEPPPSLEFRLRRSSGGRVRRPVSNWTIAALATAAVLAGLLAWQQISWQTQRAQTALALSTLVRSHFKHAAMTASAPNVPQAKVIYARDGAWVYVVTDRAMPGARVGLVSGGAVRDAGPLQSIGDAGALLVSPAGKPEAVELLVRGEPVARATLDFQ